MLRADQLALLANMPPYWRYALTGGRGANGNDSKKCFEEQWNSLGHGHTVEQVIQINEDPEPSDKWRQLTMVGVGVITGMESNGLLVLDFDGVGSQAVRAFKEHFRHNPSELPKTITNISGKRGRAKCYFTVPPEYWNELGHRSASWRDTGTDSVVLEAIWQTNGGRGRHAVIVGDHPESKPERELFYRWLEGRSPSDLPPAVAPDWLILGVLAQMEQSGSQRTKQERARSGEDDATPWERLTVQDRIQMIELALPHCPHREGKSSGTYERVRRILCGLINELGLELAVEIVERSAWNKKNEWDQGRDAAKTMASLATSRTAENQKATIASVFYLAQENGWQRPSWGAPAFEIKHQVENLKKLINQMNKDSQDDAAVASYIGRARREFGIDSAAFRRLALKQFLGDCESPIPQTLSDVRQNKRKDNSETAIIDGFLSRSVHVLAGASHSGKTTFASFLANRVITGSPIDIESTRHIACSKGKVLIFTNDMSDIGLVQELMLEGVTEQNAQGRLLICTGRNFDDMLSIVRTLESVKPDLVIYDCLSSMAAKDVKIGDPSYADPIRLLVQYNGKAWPLACHFILHHTSRDEPTRFSGGEQIKAACDEMWLYYPPELAKLKRGAPRPQIGPTRHLVMEKSRGGYAGKILSVTRNGYQGTWTFRRTQAESDNPRDFLANRFRAVLHDDWKIPSEWAADLDLTFHPRSLRRYLDQLAPAVLETSVLRSKVTHREEVHYRPTDAIRQAAQQMLQSSGDGVNVVE